MLIFSVNAIPGWLYNVDRLYMVKFYFLPIGQRCLKACFLLAGRKKYIPDRSTTVFYIFLRAKVKWQLLCLRRPFCILERCLDSNPESICLQSSKKCKQVLIWQIFSEKILYRYNKIQNLMLIPNPMEMYKIMQKVILKKVAEKRTFILILLGANVLCL